MASANKHVTREVSFPFCLSESDLSFPLSTSSPRMYSSSVELKSNENCNEIEEDLEISELPTLDFEKTKKGVGIPLIAGQTENETKARKMNKTEESRLETLRSHFEKQKTMFQKQFSQSERRFRIRSARVLPNQFDDVMKVDGNTSHLRTRPKSLPAHYPSAVQKSDRSKNNEKQQKCDTGKPCPTCHRIQNVVKQYESEMKTNFDVENTHHTVCLFSDAQIRNFINLVETKYCKELPGVIEMLHNHNLKNNGIQNGNLSVLSSTRKPVGINDRIREFCKSQDEFNKKHPISRSVKTFIDNKRIEHAKLATKSDNVRQYASGKKV